MGKPLLDLFRDVALDADEQAAFEADPSGYLSQHGYQDLPVDDLTEAVGLMTDTLPADQAEAIGPMGDVPGTGADGGASWVDALQRVDDPGATPPPVASDEADETTTTFGDADFDNDTHGALEDATSPPDPDGAEDDETALDLLESDSEQDDTVDFGAGSADSASEEAPLSPDAEDMGTSVTEDLDFGEVASPLDLGQAAADQPFESEAFEDFAFGEDDGFNAADELADQAQQSEPDKIEDVDDIGSF